MYLVVFFFTSDEQCRSDIVIRMPSSNIFRSIIIQQRTGIWIVSLPKTATFSIYSALYSYSNTKVRPTTCYADGITVGQCVTEFDSNGNCGTLYVADLSSELVWLMLKFISSTRTHTSKRTHATSRALGARMVILVNVWRTLARKGSTNAEIGTMTPVSAVSDVREIRIYVRYVSLCLCVWRRVFVRVFELLFQPMMWFVKKEKIITSQIVNIFSWRETRYKFNGAENRLSISILIVAIPQCRHIVHWLLTRSDRGREHLCNIFFAYSKRGRRFAYHNHHNEYMCVMRVFVMRCVHIDCSWNFVLHCRSVGVIRSHSPVYSRNQHKRGAHKCCFFSSGETHEVSEKKNGLITSEWENKITKHSVWLTCQTNLSALNQAAFCALILSTHEYTSSMMAAVWFFSSLPSLSAEWKPPRHTLSNFSFNTAKFVKTTRGPLHINLCSHTNTPVVGSFFLFIAKVKNLFNTTQTHIPRNKVWKATCASYFQPSEWREERANYILAKTNHQAKHEHNVMR